MAGGPGGGPGLGAAGPGTVVTGSVFYRADDLAVPDDLTVPDPAAEERGAVSEATCRRTAGRTT